MPLGIINKYYRSQESNRQSISSRSYFYILLKLKQKYTITILALLQQYYSRYSIIVELKIVFLYPSILYSYSRNATHSFYLVNLALSSSQILVLACYYLYALQQFIDRLGAKSQLQILLSFSSQLQLQLLYFRIAALLSYLSAFSLPLLLISSKQTLNILNR